MYKYTHCRPSWQPREKLSGKNYENADVRGDFFIMDKKLVVGFHNF